LKLAEFVLNSVYVSLLGLIPVVKNAGAILYRALDYVLDYSFAGAKLVEGVVPLVVASY
jgi:hypothetical protein